jgi:hypothetical protein
MFLAVLERCCLAASLRETLIGEWTVAAKSAPTQSLYTVEFHASGRDDSILNSTIWRDDIPTSSKFSLSEDPLITQLQFAFPSDTEVSVTSVLPAPTPLAKLQIAKGPKFQTQATINNSQFAISYQNGGFVISIGESEPLEMTKIVHYAWRSVSAPGAQGQGNEPLSRLAEWINWVIGFDFSKHGQTLLIGGGIVAFYVLCYFVLDACRSICCPVQKPRRPRKKRSAARRQKAKDDAGEQEEAAGQPANQSTAPEQSTDQPNEAGPEVAGEPTDETQKIKTD